MSRATDDLRHEHDAILAALGILQNMGQQLNAGRTTGSAATAELSADIQAFIGFLQKFADKCHHGKEEGFLFPAMTAAGSPGHSGQSALVGDLFKEYEQGRERIKQKEASLQPTLDAGRFSSAARGYAEVLRSHLQKENEILSPLADKTLSPETLDALFEAYEAHEENVMGAGRHEELHGLLAELRAKYRVRPLIPASPRA